MWNNSKYYRLAIFTLLIMSFMNSCVDKKRKESPSAQGGIIDLSQWDFAKDVPVDLKGEWKFFAGKFIEPDAVNDFWQNNKSIIQLPAYWHTQPHPDRPAEKIDSIGYGSYGLRVRLNQNYSYLDLPLGILFKEAHTSALFYILDTDGKNILAKVSQGSPAASSDQEIPFVVSQLAPTASNDINEFIILVHISNHQLSKAGFKASPRIGSMEFLKEKQFTSIFTSIFLIGALVIIGLYHLIIFLQRREDKTSLAFAFFCSVMALRETVMNRIFQNFGLGESLSGFEILTSLEYLTLPFSIMTGGVFIALTVPGKLYSAFCKYVILVGGALLVAFTLVSDVLVFTRLLYIYQIYILVTSLIGISHLIVKSFQKDQGAQVMGLSLFVLLIGIANDILYFNQVINTGSYSSFTFVGFVLMQSGIISGKSAYAYKQTKLLSANLQEKNKEITFFNQNLERLVDDKTREIKGLLDHIPQGVLTIEAEGLIGKNFSAHLSEVLGHFDVAEKKFKDVIFAKSTMSADDQDQAWQAIFNAVGCDELGFILNSGKLPSEIAYTFGADAKILGSTWSPQVKDGIVESILVTLLDVTAEKKLEAEARKQQQEIAKISELIAVPESKAHNFFSTSAVLLQEIKEILDKGQDSLDEERIKLLFVNAHTVKGNARTLEFSELTEHIHLMENRYSQILRKQEDIDLSLLHDDIDRVLAVLNDYNHVNTTKLNRNAAGNFINIDRNLIEKMFYLMKDYVNGRDPIEGSYKPAFQSQGDILAKLIFEDLTQVFEDYHERVIKIANDTGREKPEIVFNVPSTVISSDQREVLDMTMIHLLRNAMDHGIEKKEDRIAKGKTPHGRLSIDVDISDDVLTMKVEDDGRGLPIASLREKGVKNRFLRSDSPLSEIAETIFNSGTSTAESITQISGRGVGMDAVRHLLEKAGGSIEIILEEEKTKGLGFFQFHFKIVLPLSQIILDRREISSNTDVA